MVEIERAKSDAELALEAENVVLRAELHQTRKAAAKLAVAIAMRGSFFGEELQEVQDEALAAYHDLKAWDSLQAIENETIKECVRRVYQRENVSLLAEDLAKFYGIKKEDK